MSMTIVDGVTVVRCDMREGCDRPIARIDRSGFIYCEPHGQDRQQGEPCRKLRPYELRAVLRGGQVKRY